MLAVALAVPLDWLARLTHPVVWALQKSANVVLRLLRVKPAPAGMIAYTREDIRHSVAAAEDVGEFEEAEEEMLYKVFDFASKEVSAVMVPRPDVVAISADMPPEEALATVVDSPYTRYPVYRNSLDEIIGILHVRDLFAAMHDLGIAAVRLESVARPAFVVPETKDLAALLADFRREKQHMAIVVDEYGGVDGIVTLEDLLEEIVGEIEDEFDLPDTSVERIDEKRVRMDGSYTIDDFNEAYGTELDKEGYHTMGGLVFGTLGRAAEVGDEVVADDLRLSVLEIEGSRIPKIEVESRSDGKPTCSRIRSCVPHLVARRSAFRHRDFALFWPRRSPRRSRRDGDRRHRLAGVRGSREPARPRPRRARRVPPAPTAGAARRAAGGPFARRGDHASPSCSTSACSSGCCVTLGGAARSGRSSPSRSPRGSGARSARRRVAR